MITTMLGAALFGLAVAWLALVLLTAHANRSDRRIDHLEGRVALLLSAFMTETTVNEAGDVVETITPKVSA